MHGRCTGTEALEQLNVNGVAVPALWPSCVTRRVASRSARVTRAETACPAAGAGPACGLLPRPGDRTKHAEQNVVPTPSYRYETGGCRSQKGRMLQLGNVAYASVLLCGEWRAELYASEFLTPGSALR